MKHPNQVFSAEHLLAHVWPTDSSASIYTLRQSFLRLRQSLAEEKDRPLIRNVYGVGYKLEP